MGFTMALVMIGGLDRDAGGGDGSEDPAGVFCAGQGDQGDLPRAASVAESSGRAEFDEVVDLLGIKPLLSRRPNTLSGGERQRVAIGRALLAQPHLLLMDEPLASLDAARRAGILPYLTRLNTALRLPILYVTHALDEAAQLADSLVLVDAG